MKMFRYNVLGVQFTGIELPSAQVNKLLADPIQGDFYNQ